MLWVSITASVLVSLGICALYVHLWRRRIRRDMETDAIIGKLRREVGEIVTELNGTTERNVALLENRIAALNDLVERAGKTSGALKRESEKHEISRQVYTSLERSRPISAGLNLDIVDDGSSEQSNSSAASGLDSSGTARTRTGKSDAGIPKADVSDKDNYENQGTETGHLLAEAVKPAKDFFADFDSLPVREKALVMYRNGESPDKIGSRLGMSLGEVELIISIHDRKVY